MATILHIAQKTETRDFIESALGEQYNIVTAVDGSMAIQYCAMLQPDLILMDSTLPDIESDQLAARLKMFMPQTPILVVIDKNSPQKKEKEFVVHRDGFLEEPLETHHLQQRVQELLPTPVQLPQINSLPTKIVSQFETQITTLNQANNRLASLNAISALIGTSLDLEHLTDEILAQIHRSIAFDSATLFLLKGDVLEAAASRGFSDYKRGMNTYSRNERNSAWRVVNNKLPLIVNDVTTSEYWEERPELSRIRSWLGVPLIHKKRIIGVLTLDKHEPHAFTDADARYLFTLAYQIATAVENAQLFEEWEKQSTRLKLINEVAQEINTILNVDHLFKALAKAIFERLQYDRVFILELDQTQTLLVMKAIYGKSLAFFEEADIYSQRTDVGLIGQAIRMGRPLLVNDVSLEEESILADGAGMRSKLVAPIFVGDKAEAVIDIGREQIGGFTDQDLWTVSSLASQAAIAIQNARLYRKVESYSVKLERTIVARTQRLQAIKKISQVVSQGLTEDELLVVVSRDIHQIFAPESNQDIYVSIGLVEGSHLVLKAISRTGNGPLKNILTLKIDPEEPMGQVIHYTAPMILDNRSKMIEESAEMVMMAPLIAGGKTIGLIKITSIESSAFDESDLETLESLAFQVASGIEHARLLRKTKEIAIVEERTRLARDMHDGVAQNLAYLRLQIDRLLEMVEEDGQLSAWLEQISSLVKQNIDELRRNIFDLRPIALEDKTLFDVLKNFVTEFGRRWGVETHWEVKGNLVEVSPEVESSLYRILQETLANARQHANCTQLSVAVTVDEAKRWITLEVEDDGRGFALDQVTSVSGRGVGLSSMRERATRVGGEFLVETESGQGTRVLTKLPLTGKE